MRIPKVNSALLWGVLIMCIKTLYSLTDVVPYSDAVDNILTAVSVLLLVISILHEKYSFGTLLIYGVITSISLFSVIKTGNYGFLITIIVCLAIREKKIDDFLNYVFKYQLVFFVFHTFIAIALASVGVIPMVKVIGGVERFSFGFSHPNTFSAYLFNLLILWAWNNYDRIRTKHIIGIMTISTIAVYLTKTRTTFLLVVIFCVLLVASKKARILQKACSTVAKYIVPICTGLTLLCVYLYLTGNKLVTYVDELLTGRIKLGAYGLTHYGYTFWGQYVEKANIAWEQGWGLYKFTFDNLYTCLAINQGILWIIVVSVLFFLLAKKKDNKVNVFLITWALYGITEVHGLNGFLCFPVFLVVLLFDNVKILLNKGEKTRNG